jgi:type II secretory pathway component PulK
VLATLMVLTVLVTEVTYTSRVRYLVSAHRRDQVQAEWLARSGANIYRLILVANKELEKSGIAEYASMFGVNIGDALWQMVPMINTGLLRMMMGSGGDVDDISEEALDEFKRTGQVADEYTEGAGEGLFSGRDFLDFDGDFAAEISDHESRVGINSFATESATVIQESDTAQRLYALLSGEENDQWFHDRNLDRWELIGNLKDWVDTDTVRSGGLGGYEDNLYNRGTDLRGDEDGYLTKNAPFESLDELHLVAGWEGALFDRYADKLTVFGDGKVNVNTAGDEVLKSTIRSCATSSPSDSELDICMREVNEYMLMASFQKGSEFAQYVLTSCGIEMEDSCANDQLTNSSKTFTVSSTGLVGTSAVTLTIVYDFSKKTTGEVLHWRLD